MSSIEQTILKSLVCNEKFARAVLPHLKEEYFYSSADKTLFKVIGDFFEKYNTNPTMESIIIEVDKCSYISDSEYTECMTALEAFDFSEASDYKWLCESTEQFCQDMALQNAIHDAVRIIEGKDDKRDRGSLPQLLSNALAVSFDSRIGHDFMEEAANRWEYYTAVETKIPFDIKILNKITKFGISPKTLTIIMAGTGVGKSLIMCHMATANLLEGKNVLYITLEMSEQKIAQRIDANLLDIDINKIEKMAKDAYISKVDKIKAKTNGKLIIKEYPTTGAGAAHFRFLLNELKVKKKFKPDIIYIDYINICCSSRIKAGVANSYTLIKSIAEELRGLGVEFDVPIVSATQVNRQGFSDSDFGLEATSESFGLPATADLFLAAISTPELEEKGQIMLKQLKNRYGDLNYYRKFLVGIDKSKMRIYDIEEEQQDLIPDDGMITDDEDDQIFDPNSKKSRLDFS